MKNRSLGRGWRPGLREAVAGIVLGLSSGALAQAGECRLALVLALDVSASVDRQEYHLQRQGLARALLAPEIVQAFGFGDPVALYVFEWANPSTQVSLGLGWHMIHEEADLARVAALIAAEPPPGTLRTSGSTALGAALDHAASVLQVAPTCRAQTVDIAGDGPNNVGYGPGQVRDGGGLDGVTVNALLIGSGEEDAALIAWFETEVLQGPRAFHIVADGYADYERAIRAKLLRELELPLVSGMPPSPSGAG